jgi:DNA mismatch repair protein MutL
LISDLHKIGKYTCPHGRPIILKMTFDEMNKKFNRK